MRRPSLRLPLMLALAILACEGPTEPPITGPYTTAIISGASQEVVRGAAAAADMVVEVRDAQGRPAPRVAVRWVPPYGVTLAVASLVTRADGWASARLRADCNALDGVVTAASVGEPANEVSFQVDVRNGAVASLFSPDSMHVLRGDVVNAVATPRDACGTRLAPVAVSWRSSADAILTVAGGDTTTGVVTAVSPGRAGAIATGGSFSDTLHVAVHAPLTGMRTLALIGDSSCGLDDAGDMYCWGWTGTVAGETATPPPVGARRVLSGYGFTHLSSRCALDRGGVAYCWGMYPGNGGTAAALTPVAVGGTLRFVDIASSGTHTCAVTAAGDAWCWGRNGHGQLGDGTTTDRLVPVAVATTHKFMQLVAAWRFTCGITAAGAAYCWGDGPAAWGSSTSQGVITPALLAGAPPFAKLAAGWTTACGLTLEGEAWCWGYSPDHFGERFLPLVISPPVRIEGTRRYETIAVGVAHACATTIGGEVDCWGANEKAQLGFYTGTTTSRFSAAPVAVDPLVKVFAAANFTCGVTAGGSAYCWGQAQAGFTDPGVTTCSWGTRISYRSYLCSRPRRVPVALPPA